MESKNTVVVELIDWLCAQYIGEQRIQNSTTCFVHVMWYNLYHSEVSRLLGRASVE